MRLLYIIIFLITTNQEYLYSQKKNKGIENHLENISINALKWRSVGPALTSGRVSDIAVNKNNPFEYYVAVEDGIYTNKEFKDRISEFSNTNHTSEIYFHLKKYAGFRKTEFTGDYEGYDFIIHGKCRGKWYEMTGPYEGDLKEFLQEIGDNEIDKLDDKLFIDCQVETDFSLEGGKIEWSDNVPEDIKNEFEEEYGTEGDDGSLLNECDWDSSGDLEFHEPYNNITSIEITIKEEEKETLVSWKNKNY